MDSDETRDIELLDESSCQVVAALADGEVVDPDALRLALGNPAVRDYLVDLIAIRRTVGAVGELPARRRDERRSRRSVIRWFSAAAAIVVSLAAGYFAGQRTVPPAPAPTVETFVDLGATAPAPKPTRVVSLRPGVNWTEKAAGEQ